jgi:ureidoacrylate peracid hydrolase
MFRDYRSLILEDCTAEPLGKGMSRSNHEASLLAIQILFGWISESAKFVAALEKSLAPVRV